MWSCCSGLNEQFRNCSRCCYRDGRTNETISNAFAQEKCSGPRSRLRGDRQRLLLRVTSRLRYDTDTPRLLVVVFVWCAFPNPLHLFQRKTSAHRSSVGFAEMGSRIKNVCVPCVQGFVHLSSDKVFDSRIENHSVPIAVQSRLLNFRLPGVMCVTSC